MLIKHDGVTWLLAAIVVKYAVKHMSVLMVSTQPSWLKTDAETVQWRLPK